MKKVLISLVVMLALMLTASLCLAEFDLGQTSVSSSGMDIHGYYEFEYWDKQGDNETFDAHKIVIWMGKAVVPDKVYISAEFEYEHFPRLDGSTNVTGTDTNADGNIDTITTSSSNTGGDGEFKVDSAILSITPVKDTRVFMGIFYVPFGIEWESYPGHKNKLITRPRAMKGNNIIKGTWSDVGIGVEQKIAGVGKVDLYGINGDAKNGGVAEDTNRSKSTGARVSLDSLVKGLNVGASYVTGRYNDTGAGAALDSTRTGIHVKANISEILGGGLMDLTLIAENVTGKDEGAVADTKVEGSYYQLSLKPIDKLEVAARYDMIDDNTDAVDNGETSTSVGLSYEIYDHTKLKIEHQANREEADLGAAGENDVWVAGVAVDW